MHDSKREDNKEEFADEQSWLISSGSKDVWVKDRCFDKVQKHFSAQLEDLFSRINVFAVKLYFSVNPMALRSHEE
jgi:hypothetical protein